jgi:hypothetical protein
VQRGVVSFGSAGADPDEFNESITSVGSLSDAFARLTTNIFGSQGPNISVAVNKNTDDVGMSCFLQAVNNVRFVRTTAGEDADYDGSYEVWEYIGDAGGPNEFIVRSISIAALVNTASATVDISSIGISDFTNVVPFITGITSDNTTPDWSISPTVRIDTITEELIFERTTTTGRTGVRYAVVEFTGANWTVQQNISHTYTAAGTDETETITSVGSWARSFIVASHHTDQTGLDETAYTVRPGSTLTTVRFRLRSGATVATDERTIAFVVSHVDATAGPNTTEHNLAVTHDDTITGSLAELASGNLTQTHTFTAVQAIANCAVIGSADCAGGGVAYPRQFWGYELTNTTTVTWTRGRSGQASDAVIQVLEFPKRVINGDVDANAGAATVTIDADHIVEIPEGAARFDGSATADQHLYAAHAADLSLDAENTLAVLVKLRDTGSDSMIFTKSNIAGTAFEYELEYLEAIPAFRWTVRDNQDSTNVSVTSTVEPEANRWYIIICGFSESISGGLISIQLYSVEDGGQSETVQVTTKSGLQAGAINTADFWVGYDPVLSSDSAFADIAQVRRWDAVIITGTLANLVNGGKGRTYRELEEFGGLAGAAWNNLVYSFELDEVDANASRAVARRDLHTSGLELLDGGGVVTLDLVGSVSGHRTVVSAGNAVIAETTDKLIQCGQFGVDFDLSGGNTLNDATPAVAWDIGQAAGHTFEVWFYADTLAGGGGSFSRIFGRWESFPSVSERYKLQLSSAGKLTFYVDANSPNRQVTAPGNLVAQRLYQAICEVDFIANEIRITVSSIEDGFAFATNTNSGTISLIAGGPDLRLGSDPSLANAKFDGMICRLRKWEGIFTTPQLSDLFNLKGAGHLYNFLPAPFGPSDGAMEGAYEMLEYSSGAVEVRRFDFFDPVQANALRDTNTLPSRAGIPCPVFADPAEVTIDADHVVQFGQAAADFPGGNQDLSTPANAALDLDDSVGHTFEVWFYFDNLPATPLPGQTRIFGRSTLSGDKLYSLTVFSNGSATWTAYGPTAVSCSVPAGSVIEGIWYQAICEVDIISDEVRLKLSRGCEYNVAEASQSGTLATARSVAGASGTRSKPRHS